MGGDVECVSLEQHDRIRINAGIVYVGVGILGDVHVENSRPYDLSSLHAKTEMVVRMSLDRAVV